MWDSNPRKKTITISMVEANLTPLHPMPQKLPYKNTLVSLLLQVDTPVQMRFMIGLSISNNVFLYGDPLWKGLRNPYLAAL